MNESNELSSRSWRYAIYGLMIASTLAAATGRVMSVAARDQRTPFLSANDRSRWSTVAALVDDGTYVIDRFQTDKSWQTIDKVWHVGRDGQNHFFSSKPPLLSTLVAGEYWVIQRLTGLKLEVHPFILGRAMLWLTNVPLFGVFLVGMTLLVEQFGRSDWGRIFVVLAGCWSTFLTTFVVTLNNHLPAAVCVMVTVYCLWRIRDVAASRGWIALAGATSAFAVTCELPALSFFAIVALCLLVHRPRECVVYFVPAALLVAAAFFATNYLANGDWRVAYSHREWYNYEGSYWTGPRSGPDRGEPSRVQYLAHVLIGHHGVISLTPIWCLSVWGGWRMWRERDRPFQRWMAAGACLLFVVCVAFYVSRPEIDRNYGGVTCGVRWLFWLIPLALLTMVEAADVLSFTRPRRAIGALLLVISTFSASYGWSNPWVNPWPYAYGVAQGWIQK